MIIIYVFVDAGVMDFLFYDEYIQSLRVAWINVNEVVLLPSQCRPRILATLKQSIEILNPRLYFVTLLLLLLRLLLMKKFCIYMCV